MPPNWKTDGNAAASGDFLGTTNAQPLVVQTNATERLRVRSDGNVGIGHQNPRTLLHVLGRISTGLDHTSAGAITLFPPDGFAWFHIDNGPAGGRPIGRLRFSHGVDPGSQELMTLLQNGNAGVGTPNPATKFHVDGNRIRLESGGRRLDLRADGAALDVQSDTHNLYLHSSGPSGRNNVFINPFGGQGNVGIGTQGPATKFHVDGNRIRIEQRGKRLDLRADGGSVDVQSETHNLYLHSNGPSGRNNVFINPFGGEGNVGIGTQGPAAKLHVVGDVRANDFIVTSDRRLKTGIRPLENALRKLQSLRGVEFSWKADAEHAEGEASRRIGVVAQEVEGVAPELVGGQQGDGMRGVNLTGLVAMLIESTKELVAENAALRGRIEALERQTDASAGA